MSGRLTPRPKIKELDGYNQLPRWESTPPQKIQVYRGSELSMKLPLHLLASRGPTGERLSALGSLGPPPSQSLCCCFSWGDLYCSYHSTFVVPSHSSSTRLRWIAKMFSSFPQSAFLIARRSNKSPCSRLLFSCAGWLLPATTTAATGAVRSKHSNTQIKRLFKYNGGRIRSNIKRGIKPKYDELPEQQFPKVHQFKYYPNTWTEPPLERPEYPFTVHRTKNKPNDAIGFLPVYTKHRCVRNKRNKLHLTSLTISSCYSIIRIQTETIIPK